MHKSDCIMSTSQTRRMAITATSDDHGGAEGVRSRFA